MFMEELIGTELDNLGNEIKVYFCSHETMPAKVTAFFARQWAELLELGFANANYIPNIYACRVIYITANDEITGLRVWVWEQNTTRIILTSIDKNHRRRGLFELITKHYDNRIKNSDAIKSKTQIHIDNTQMIKAAEKTGYKLEFVIMAKEYK